MIYAIVVAVKANQFVSSGNQSYTEANALTSGGLVVILPLIAQLGSLLLTIGFIWTALNTLRVGLLPRPLAYAGVLAGALVLFPLGVFVPFVQGFWLVGVSILSPDAGRAAIPPPGGRGSPSPGRRRVNSASRRRRLAVGPALHAGAGPASARSGLRRRAAAPVAPAATVTAAEDDDVIPARTRASTPKRKRKRRS